MLPNSTIYPPEFSRHGIVGILWSDKAVYNTWFGGSFLLLLLQFLPSLDRIEFIHCIQMMPFTPVTELLLPASWMAYEYPILSLALLVDNPPITEDWKAYVVMAHAIIDKVLPLFFLSPTS